MLSKIRSKNKARRVIAKRRYSKNPDVDIFDLRSILKFKGFKVKMKVVTMPSIEEGLKRFEFTLPATIGVNKLSLS